MFKYSNGNKTVEKLLFKYFKYKKTYKVFYFRCQVNCGSGLISNTNLGAHLAFYKTKIKCN